MICTVCGDPAVISRKHRDMCQFCWDCLQHELMIRLRAIREFGEYHRDNRGPRFLATFYTGEYTLGYGLYLPRTPQQAMNEALRTAVRNNWQLLRVDIQKTLTDIFVSEDYAKHMPYSQKTPLPYDGIKYGATAVIDPGILRSSNVIWQG